MNIFFGKTNRFYKNKSSFFEVLKNSIMKSINTSLIILGNLIIFTVITNLIKHYINISPLVLSILSGILELTNGVVSVSSLDITLYLRIVLTSFLINFTGLSIIFQSMSILGKYKLNIITTEMNYNEQPVEKTR